MTLCYSTRAFIFPNELLYIELVSRKCDEMRGDKLFLLKLNYSVVLDRAVFN